MAVDASRVRNRSQKRVRDEPERGVDEIKQMSVSGSIKTPRVCPTVSKEVHCATRQSNRDACHSPSSCLLASSSSLPFASFSFFFLPPGRPSSPSCHGPVPARRATISPPLPARLRSVNWPVRPLSLLMTSTLTFYSQIRSRVTVVCAEVGTNVAHLAPRLTPHSASVSNSSATVAHPVGHVPNATQSLGVFILPQLQKKCAYPCHPVFPDFPHSLSSATCIPSTTALSKSSLSSPSLPHRVHAHIIFTTNYLVCQHSPIVPSSQSGNQALLSHYRSTTSLPYGSTNSISARIFYPFNLFHPFRPALLTLQIMSKSNQPTLHFPPTTSPVLLTRPYIFSCPHGLLTTLLPHPPRRNPLP
jgi:hypothetical protein